MERNSLEGNIDLRTVQWTEMPLKELLRDLGLSSPSSCFTLFPSMPFPRHDFDLVSSRETVNTGF